MVVSFLLKKTFCWKRHICINHECSTSSAQGKSGPWNYNIWLTRLPTNWEIRNGRVVAIHTSTPTLLPNSQASCSQVEARPHPPCFSCTPRLGQAMLFTVCGQIRARPCPLHPCSWIRDRLLPHTGSGPLAESGLWLHWGLPIQSTGQKKLGTTGLNQNVLKKFQ